MRLFPALALGLACATAAGAAPAKIAPRVSQQAQALAQAVRDGRAEVSGVEAQIAHLRGRLVALAAIEAAGERGAVGKTARLAALTAREQALTARFGASQNATARLLGTLALFGRDPPPALLVHPRSAKDAVRAQILARALAPELQRRSRALAGQLKDLRVLRRQVDAASEDLFSSESALADQRAQLEQMLADRTALQRSLSADAEDASRRLNALARASGVPADLLARLPAGADGRGPPPRSFVEPVQGRLVSRYGQTASGAPEQGLTWRASPGAPVLAPAAAQVEYAGPLKDYGTVLILRSGGGYDLVLTGLGAAEAVAGRTVAAGEPVGRMPEDAGPGPPLHLEVRRGGETVDPAHWFKPPVGSGQPARSVR